MQQSLRKDDGSASAKVVCKHHPASQWSEERTERARELWLKGWSAKQIADDLGGLTRNAVIGRLSRLGLKRDPATTAATRTASNKARARVQREEAAPKLRLVCEAKPAKPKAPEGPAPLMLKLEQLSPFTCRWPIGEPGEEGFGFCGCRADEGKSYCDFHQVKAHQPPDRKRTAKELIRSLRRVA